MADQNNFKGYIVINDLQDSWTDDQVSKFRHFAEENGKLFYFCSLNSASISFVNERHDHERREATY